MDKITVVAFGLTGFGNSLVHCLWSNPRVSLVHVYTRVEDQPLPYYACEPLESLCGKLNVPCSRVASSGAWQPVAADLALISSFHRIFSEEQIRLYSRCINIHPSLLPSHRGPTPTNWAVYRGEEIAGLTAHLVQKDVDAGPIIFQERLLNPCLTDAELRKALSFLSQKMINAVIENYPEYPVTASPYPASIEPRRTEADAILEIDDLASIGALIRHIKAFTNYPMPKIRTRDNKIFIIDYQNPTDTLEITIGADRFSLLGSWQP